MDGGRWRRGTVDGSKREKEGKGGDLKERGKLQIKLIEKKGWRGRKDDEGAG